MNIIYLKNILLLNPKKLNGFKTELSVLNHCE